MRTLNPQTHYEKHGSASGPLQFTPRPPDGVSTPHFECVTANRQGRSLDVTYVDGVRKHIELDPDTGKPRREDTIFSDGLKRHIEYDPVTGAQILEDIEHADGYTTHTEFDPNTGKQKSRDIRYADGSQIHVEYDPASGKRTREDITVKGSGRSDCYRLTYVHNPACV